MRFDYLSIYSPYMVVELGSHDTPDSPGVGTPGVGSTDAGGIDVPGNGELGSPT
jgi:hypothetical protein